MNPYFNHAIEDYLMENFNEECFMLWRNTKSVLVGKNQNTLSEINLDYVKEKDITVVRRRSGGGAVFFDPGNLAFTFISNVNESKFADFESFARPIIEALKSLGIKNVEFSGRNDITVNGKKISGNAQHRHKNRIVHHGTILYSADFSELIGSLNVREVKFKDKAVKSVEGRVTNLIDHMEEKLSVEEFKEYVTNHVANTIKGSKIYEFSNKELEEIQKIADNRYATWEWTFGKSPKYDFHNEDKFKCGVLETYVIVDKGHIKEIRFFGDFFGREDIKGLEELLTGKKYDEDEIKDLLNKTKISNYINNIEVEDILSLIFK